MTSRVASQRADEPAPPGRGPTVSCVMPVLNGEEYLDEAIRSVYEQVGLDDWELLLVDDGSVDGSVAIAESWAGRDPDRIRFLTHPGSVNRGASASRNLGVRHAHGTWIGFLDCDDVWLPSTLAHRMRVLHQHPQARALIGGTWRWFSWMDDERSGVLDREQPLPQPVAPAGTVVAPPELFAPMFGVMDDRPIPTMCSLLVRRDSLLALGGFDDDFRDMHDDQVLYAKIAISMPSIIDHRPLALYRYHDASTVTTTVAAGGWRDCELRFLDWLEAHVRAELGDDAPELDIVHRHLERHGVGGHRPSVARRLVRRIVPTTARRAMRELPSRLRRSVRCRLHDTGAL